MDDRIIFRDFDGKTRSVPPNRVVYSTPDMDDPNPDACLHSSVEVHVSGQRLREFAGRSGVPHPSHMLRRGVVLESGRRDVGYVLFTQVVQRGDDLVFRGQF